MKSALIYSQDSRLLRVVGGSNIGDAGVEGLVSTVVAFQA
jgi:hypothetical protein